VQDAVNLGWKLAQVVKGASPESLLDSPVVKNICFRVKTSFTGRLVWRAAMAAKVTCGHVLKLVPKAPSEAI
jgi:hypothetical protein